jgi:hypothetical protein
MHSPLPHEPGVARRHFIDRLSRSQGWPPQSWNSTGRHFSDIGNSTSAQSPTTPTTSLVVLSHKPVLVSTLTAASDSFHYFAGTESCSAQFVTLARPLSRNRGANSPSAQLDLSQDLQHGRDDLSVVRGSPHPSHPATPIPPCMLLPFARNLILTPFPSFTSDFFCHSCRLVPRITRIHPTILLQASQAVYTRTRAVAVRLVPREALLALSTAIVTRILKFPGLVTLLHS